MIDIFNKIVASTRYLFIVVVVVLLAMSIGAFAAALIKSAGMVTGEPGLGYETAITLISGAIRASFLYFLAVAFAGLFLGDVPGPQWMAVRNLHQLRTKVLTFVSIILPLAFMGRFAHGDETAQELLYAGGAVFLVLAGIFLLVRYGANSGDESQARETNRVPDGGGKKQPQRQGRQQQRGRGREEGREGAKSGRHKDGEWLKKQKDNLKFEKDSLKGVPEGDKSSSSGRSNVTVKPGPRRPRRR
jgi:uncharacterized membrane protein YqhA